MLLDNCAQMRPPVQPTITPARRQSVVVVGGGFAGLNLIQHLRDAPVNIVLVDRCNHHFFQPLLYQVATAALAPAEITEPTRSILRNARNVMMTLIVPSAEPLTIAADVGFPDEPFAYISCVMQKIAEGWPNSRIDELMPWAWRPVAQQKAA
jgi:hypothetical protein